MGSKILVAIDGSESSMKAAAFASQWASKVGCSITLIHVHSGKSKPDPGIFAEAVQIFKRKGLRARRRFATGNPARAICEAARTGNYDLVILGRRGFSKLRRLLVGSVSQKVLSWSKCPVTVVH